MQAARGQVGWGGVTLPFMRTSEQNQWWKETGSGSIKKELSHNLPYSCKGVV